MGLSLPGVGGALTGGADALSSIFGQSQAAQNEHDQKAAAENALLQRQREFARQQGLQEGSAANQLQRQQDMAPIRDKLMAMLGMRAGQTPGQFQAGGLFGSGVGTMGNPGGINLGAQQAASASYQPGQGGVNTGVAQHLLSHLGYTGQGDQAHVGQAMPQFHENINMTNWGAPITGQYDPQGRPNQSAPPPPAPSAPASFGQPNSFGGPMMGRPQQGYAPGGLPSGPALPRPPVPGAPQPQRGIYG